MKDRAMKRGRYAVAIMTALTLSAPAAACEETPPAATTTTTTAQVPDTTGTGLTAPVAAGDLKAGDPRVDGSLIPIGVSRFSMTALAGTEKRELGVLTQEVTRVNAGGRELLRMVMSMKSPAGNGVDTALVDAKTLAPVSLRGHSDAGTIALDFNGVKVLGTKVDPEGSAQPVTQTMAAPAYDASVLDFLVAALPLSLGYTARIPVFMFEQGGLEWYAVRVSGEVMAGGEPAYGVDVRVPVGLARYSIAKKDRRLLASTITFTQGGASIQMTRLPD